MRRKEFTRVRLEGQHSGRQAMPLRGIDQLRHQRNMAKVHAIEVTDGENDGSGNGTRVAAKDAHGIDSEKPWIIAVYVSQRCAEKSLNFNHSDSATIRFSL